MGCAVNIAKKVTNRFDFKNAHVVIDLNKRVQIKY